jgi:hypothetical protein
MNRSILESKDKLIEKTSLKSLVNKTIDEVVMSGNKWEGTDVYDSYGHLYLKNLNEIEKSNVCKIFCDRLDLSFDIIIVEIDEIEYKDSIVYEPLVKYRFDTPFTIKSIEVHGQKGSFHFEGKEIHPLWFRGQPTPDILDYIVDSENALILVSTDGRRIFIAHDSSPRFVFTASEVHILRMLNDKNGFEDGYFQLQRVVE